MTVLTPEERLKIYEEEKARIENQEPVFVEQPHPPKKKKQPWLICTAAILGFFFLLGVLGNTQQDAEVKPIVKQTEITALSEETPKEPEPNWEYAKQTDDLSGKSVFYANVKSSNFQSFDFPYTGETHGWLRLRKHPRFGKDIIFQIEQGQLLCHNYDSCPVSIRFDNNSVIKVQGSPSEDNSSEVVFLPYSRFIKKIKKSKKIVIGMPVYQEGEPTFIFDTPKLEWDE